MSDRILTLTFFLMFIAIIFVCANVANSQVVKVLLASMEGSRIHLEQFPAYALELNPDEEVWNYLKRVELKNVNCQNLDQLRDELRKAKERLRHKTEVIKSFSRMAGLY